MITESTTLREITRQLGQEKHAARICPMDFLAEEFGLDEDGSRFLHEVMGSRRFSQLQLREIIEILPDWNLKSMLKGLRFLEEQLRKQPVFYKIYAEEDEKDVDIAAFPAGKDSPFVIICPGGGYENVCSVAEGYPIAESLNEMGITSFILRYRTGKEALAPEPQMDAAQALRFILNNKEMFGIDPKRYSLIGFSAGGHLAASMCAKAVGFARYGLPAPECVILGYPVLTMGEYAHEGSRRFLLGPEPTEEKKALYSVEKQIDEHFPPVYMWQCEEDAVVPIQNTMLLERALSEKGILYRYRVYPGNAHGWGRADDTPAQGWLKDAVSFWQEAERINRERDVM